MSAYRPVDDFEKINRIGEGTYGTVYRAKDKRTGKIVALKRVLLHNESSSGFPLTALRELKLLQRIQPHDYIVRFLGMAVGEKRSSVFLIFEYCAHDLAYVLDMPMNKSAAASPPFGPSAIKCLMRQLFSAVQHLHARFIIHRDLKMSNLLYTQQGQLKVADFGLAREFGHPGHAMTPKVVTLWYRAPELLLGCENYSTAIDLWACGCIFGELMLHSPLMPGKNEMEQLQCMFELLGRPNEKIWPRMMELPNAKLIEMKAFGSIYNNLAKRLPRASKQELDLINRLLTYDPKQRLTAADAMNHPYFLEKPFAKDEYLMPTFPSKHDEMKTPKQKATDTMFRSGYK